MICACELAKAGFSADDSQAHRKHKVVAAIKETSRHLGNTPAICKASYVLPAILSHYERGKVVERYFGTVEELVTHKSRVYTATSGLC